MALRPDGTVAAWGYNGVNRLLGVVYCSSFGTVSSDRPMIADVSALKGLDVTQSATAGVRVDGTVVTWGANDHEQLGHAPLSSTCTSLETADRPTAREVPGLADVATVDGGQFHFLALTASGTVLGWGRNAEGQLGPGWEYRFQTTTFPWTLKIKTPQGGELGYDIKNQHFPGLSSPGVTEVHSVVVTTRWTRDQGATETAEWKYDYFTSFADAVVYTPTGARITYTHEAGTALPKTRDVSALVEGGDPENPQIGLCGTARSASTLIARRDYASNFSYHPSGAIAEYTAGNGIPFVFTYDPHRYWPTSISSGPLQLTYDYDEVGSVESIGDGRGGSWNQAFTYDDLDRLATASGAYGSVTYGYDLHGNMTSQGSDVFTYDPLTLRMAARNGQAIAYDNNGSVGADGDGTYTYTARNQMAAATANGATSTYKYDADEWRVMKTTADGTTYYVRGLQGQVLSELIVTTGGSVSRREYVYAGARLIAVIER